MIKEEKELRKHLCEHGVVDMELAGEQITALIRAVRADEREKCAKVALDHALVFINMAERAHKNGHSVDDIVARRIACEDVAAAIRQSK